MRRLATSEIMRLAVKSPLPAFEYLKWALSVPRGARYDLTASGMPDAVGRVLNTEGGDWPHTLDVMEHAGRDGWAKAVAHFERAVAERYGVEPDCVSLSMGGGQSITQVLMGLVRAGDHVVVERPTYEPLHRVPEILGAAVSRLERKFEEDWRIVPDRLARLLTPRTRAVVLSSLHNPSGAGLRREILQEIADLSARVGAMVLVDEVYLDYCFTTNAQAEHIPAALVAENAVSWSSASKCFGFPSLRAGWIVTRHPEAARSVRNAADYLQYQPPVTTAALGTLVLEHADELTAHATRAVAAGRRIVVRWLEGEARLRWVAPVSGISGLIRLPELMSDLVFCDHLRDRYDTQIIPGSLFEAPGFVRLGFGLEAADLEQALANISAALDDLR